MNKYFLTFLSVLSGLLFVGCSSDNDGENNNNEPPVNISLSRSQQDIVDSQSRFAFDFFKQTSAWAGNEKNIVISPLSLSIDLAMLANGAGERTYEDIVAALHLPNTSTDELNTLYNTLVNELRKADRKVDLSIANGIWNDKDASFKDGFVSSIKTYYGADFQSLDFSNSEGSKNTINNWASEKTNGKISNVFDDDEDTSSTSFILCNALSFNGKWTAPFDEKDTELRFFTNIDNSETKVETMVKRYEMLIYSHAVTESAEIISLPYGNRTFSMYVILPSVENDDRSYETIYEEFIGNLDYDWWTKTKTQMKNNELLRVALPKFKVETTCPMIGLTTLHELRNVVTNPDMSMMTDSDINFLRLDQYNSVEVSENGTVAASVSKGDLMASCPSYTPVNINRPFIFLIEEQSTGTILFIGKVVKL